MTLIEKIKLLFAAKKPATELVDEVKKIKAGYKTVAFWVTVLSTLGSLVAALQGFIPATLAVVAGTAVTLLYNVLRAIQNAGVDGVTPPLQSTRFWTGILALAANAIVSLQTGGINPAWLLSVQTVIAAVMAAAQTVGAAPADQPKQ